MGQASIPYISTVERHPQPTIYTTQCLCVCVFMCRDAHSTADLSVCSRESTNVSSLCAVYNPFLPVSLLPDGFANHVNMQPTLNGSTLGHGF